MAGLVATAPTPAAPVVVDGVPISRGHLRRWADIAQRSSPGTPRQPAREQAAGLLISGRWIRGEARERGIVVTREEVTASFRTQRRDVFPDRKDYVAFLRESGQTTRDVRYRVALNLLSERLREQVVGAIADPEDQQRALDAFVRDYRAKWRARTVCRKPWIAFECRRHGTPSGDLATHTVVKSPLGGGSGAGQTARRCGASPTCTRFLPSRLAR